MNKLLRQGDVLLVPVPVIPASAKVQEREGGRVILAHGEVTGHAHAITDAGAVKLADGIEEYLRLKEDSLLHHEEHTPFMVPAGNYRIVHQVEYTPSAMVRVRD